MTGMNARDFAVLSLDDRDLPGLPRQAFKRRSAKRPADARDAALGETIVAGVIKHLVPLRHLLATYAKRPLDQVDARAELILLVALYQLRHLDRVPSRAAVSEAVGQTRSLGIPRTSGFVNAVLRQALRKPRLDLPPRSDAIAFADLVLGHPPECFTRLRKVMGERDALRCCRRNNRPPPMLVRLNAGKTIDGLATPGVTLRPHEQAGIVVAEGAKVADFARWAESGVGQVQDATSAAAVPLLDLRPGVSVLDRCCGVGTKTLQIRDVCGDCPILALDASGKRINLLKRTLAARGVGGVEAKRAEWLADGEFAGRTFDRILIDAPCSNSGVLARRPEARYHQSSTEVRAVVELQRRILADTLPALAPGGRLVYATCSIWPEENEQLVAAALADTPGVELVEDRTILPSLGRDPTTYHDGGYAAVLRRPG